MIGDIRRAVANNAFPDYGRCGKVVTARVDSVNIDPASLQSRLGSSQRI